MLPDRMADRHMSERLVPVVEPRVRKRVAYALILCAFAITALVRVLVGYDALLLAGEWLVAGAVGVAGMMLWERRASHQMVTKAERTRRYIAAFSRWESVLVYAGTLALCFALLQDDENYHNIDNSVSISAAFGLFAGLAMDAAARWSQTERD
jgi:hypothetical protein